VDVDDEPYSGGGNSLAAVDGRPAISYDSGTDSPASQLRYAYASTPDGSGPWELFTIDNQFYAAGDTALAVVNGRPAIAYQNVQDHDLRFALSIQADGRGGWTTQTIDSAGDVGDELSLAVVGGRPAISYAGPHGTDSLRFALSGTFNGSGSWSIQLLDDLALPPYANLANTALRIVNGNPAILYYHRQSDKLRYAYCDRSDGTAQWSIHDLGALASGVMDYSAFAVIAGRPAIAYRDGAHSRLVYAVNSQADGLGNWVKSYVSDYPNDAYYPDMAQVDGKPAIVHESSGFYLWYSILF
jgi:hypothetical protein